jgi:hypothetical protein
LLFLQKSSAMRGTRSRRLTNLKYFMAEI